MDSTYGRSFLTTEKQSLLLGFLLIDEVIWDSVVEMYEICPNLLFSVQIWFQGRSSLRPIGLIHLELFLNNDLR